MKTSMIKNLEEKSLRDTLLKISELCSDYSVLEEVSDFNSFGTLLKLSSNRSINEMDKCLSVKSSSTKSLEQRWPLNLH